MYKLTTDDSESTSPELTQSLDELAREGARRLIAEGLRLEVDEYVAKLRHLRDERGHALVVRNGRARERTVQLGVGPVPRRRSKSSAGSSRHAMARRRNACVKMRKLS